MITIFLLAALADPVPPVKKEIPVGARPDPKIQIKKLEKSVDKILIWKNKLEGFHW